MKILILGRNDKFTKIIFNKIYGIEKEVYLITEDPPSKIKFLIKRIKKMGLFKVIGQILFILIIIPYLKIISQKRINELMKESNFSTELSNIRMGRNYFHYDTINSEEVKKKILEINPEIIIVNGTRIIKKNILSALKNISFINMHSGITPKYRGVHGGYWSLVNNDKENCGVTIHKVDSGIDTGEIISQKIIKVSSSDNIITYPYLQLKIGIEEEIKIIFQIKNNKKIEYIKNNLESKLYSHPTLFEYIYNWIKKDVK